MNHNMLLLSFWCDLQGQILAIVQDNLETNGPAVHPDETLFSLVDSESAEKAFNFLQEVKERESAFDWPLGIRVENEIELLYFCGWLNDQKIFMIATKSKTYGHLETFHEELMKINNEQTNLLRTVMKEQALASQASSNQIAVDTDSRLYEELSLLNNELANAQRELVKKNSQLETLNHQLQTTVDELQRTRQELIQSEKMASLGRLVAGFAHEINTPIGIALTAGSVITEGVDTIDQMLAAEEVSEKELTKVLEKTQQAGQLVVANLNRAANLVGSFKRTSIDQIHEAKRLFDLNRIFEDTVFSLAGKFKQTAISIEIFCPSGINIYGYPGIISQVLANLLLNSWLHGFDSGQLAGNITVEAGVKDNHIEINYHDTGKGISEQVLKNLFEPFHTTKRARGSTGLGLYLCYNIVVSQLNGKISCKSQVNQGCTFYISFPFEIVSDDIHHEIDPR